jgi:hypothetical protein
MTQHEGLALSGFPNLVFRHLVRLFGYVTTPPQGLFLSAQNIIDEYAYARSGTKIKSDMFVEGRVCSFGCDC